MVDFCFLARLTIIQLHPSYVHVPIFSQSLFCIPRFIWCKCPVLFGWTFVFQVDLPLEREVVLIFQIRWGVESSWGGDRAGPALDQDGSPVGIPGRESAGGEEGEEGGPGHGGDVVGPAAEVVSVEPHARRVQSQGPAHRAEVDSGPSVVVLLLRDGEPDGDVPWVGGGEEDHTSSSRRHLLIDE